MAVPVAAWMAYFRWKDNVDPDPWWMMAPAFVLGIGSAFAAIYGYRLVHLMGLTSDPWLLRGTPLLGYSLAVIGPIEEIAKALPVYLVLVYSRRFNHMTDGILYPALVALGFATFENLFYLHRGMIREEQDLLWRAVAGPFAHMAFAALWGWGLVKWKLRASRRFRWVFLGLLFSFISHGIYDFAALSGGWHKIFSAALVLVIWIFMIGKWAEENARLRRAMETGDLRGLEQSSVGLLQRIVERKQP